MTISFFDFVGVAEIGMLLKYEDDLEDTFRNEVQWFYETSKIEQLTHGNISIYKEINGKNLFIKHNNQLVGGYCESVLWVDPIYRGKKIGYILIDATAKARNNVLYAENFTYAGLMLHLKYYIKKFNKENTENIKIAERLLNSIDRIPEKSLFDVT